MCTHTYTSIITEERGVININEGKKCEELKEGDLGEKIEGGGDIWSNHKLFKMHKLKKRMGSKEVEERRKSLTMLFVQNSLRKRECDCRNFCLNHWASNRPLVTKSTSTFSVRSVPAVRWDKQSPLLGFSVEQHWCGSSPSSSYNLPAFYCQKALHLQTYLYILRRIFMYKCSFTKRGQVCCR